ncbi:MAG: alpha/beta fold hydrolase [Promethearchaeota archaeon]|jgi:pimeloyl-ACP methyl ester carboxylesterase
MVKIKPEYGIFKNSIPYARFGEGKKILLLLFGGPGNEVPKGFIFNTLVKGLNPFTEEYTIYIVTRKSGLHEGYSTKDMSDDYAEMIRDEFEGKVDLIIGISYGGIIAQHFAADHSELFDHIVIAMAAHKISEKGKQLDIKFAELLSEGNYKSAYVTIADALYPPSFKRRFLKGILWVAGSFAHKPESETFSQDVLIEAKAEVEHESVESLKKISVPVLILCGDKDFYFPSEYIIEMDSLISNSALKFYKDKGHEIIGDSRFAEDIFEFINTKN